MTQLHLAMWQESRTRFSNQLQTISEMDLRKKLFPSPNSAGFLIRHIGDVELLFAKNVFGMADVKVVAKTVIDKKDDGSWTDLTTLIQYVSLSSEWLQKAIKQQTETDWQKFVETKEFGKKSMSEALGRITSHTAYHAGQLALVLKYGSI